MINVRCDRVNSEISENRGGGLGVLGERHRVRAHRHRAGGNHRLRTRPDGQGDRQQAIFNGEKGIYAEGVQMLYDWQEREGNQHGVFRARFDCDKQGSEAGK